MKIGYQLMKLLAKVYSACACFDSPLTEALAGSTYLSHVAPFYGIKVTYVSKTSK